MRLVTFQKGDSHPRAGALVDGDARVVDLAEAHAAAFGREGLGSVLSIVEGGDAALGQAYEAVKKAPASATLARADVRLRAPIQPPPQMRDCLCFECTSSRRLQPCRRWRPSRDPIRRRRSPRSSGAGCHAPPTFYKQPIYYKANRFAVIGTDEDVVWPPYSKFLDFELEFGVYIKGRSRTRQKPTL